MFSKEFFEDFEKYGKGSESCKTALEQLFKALENEKGKVCRDLEQEQTQLIKQKEETLKSVECLDNTIKTYKQIMSEKTFNELSKLSTSEHKWLEDTDKYIKELDKEKAKIRIGIKNNKKNKQEKQRDGNHIKVIPNDELTEEDIEMVINPFADMLIKSFINNK